MSRLKPGIGILAALVLLVTLGFAEARTLQGQVQAITITQCDIRPGSCEGIITLLADGATRQVLVTSETEITRAGRPIMLGEVGIGNVVTLDEFEPVPGTRFVHPRRIQAP
jgi:hypothetical protein